MYAFISSYISDSVDSSVCALKANRKMFMIRHMKMINLFKKYILKVFIPYSHRVKNKIKTNK